MITKPYQGLIRQPTNFIEPKDLDDSPNANMNLEWIYGYRSKDCINNLKYTKLGEIVYMNAATNIVYDQGHRQRFHKDHSEDIISLAIDPKLRYVGTGEYSQKPKLIVWDSTSMDSISIIVGLFSCGICNLSFDSTSTLIAAIGMDKQHTIGVYNWQQKRLLYCAQSGVREVYACEYHRFNNTLITCGQQHIKYWNPNGNSLSMVLMSYNEPEAEKKRNLTFYSIITSHEYEIFGASDGSLLVFSNMKLLKSIKAHEGPIYSLCLSNEEHDETIHSGGKDGKIFSWSSDSILYGTNPIEIKWIQGNETVSGIRSLCAQDSNLLIGTENSEIFELRASVLKKVTQGHSTGELWGVATCPIKKSKEFSTCGDDRRLLIWDYVKRRCIQQVVLKAAGRCVEYSPNGLQIAVGLFDGMVKLVIIENRSAFIQKN